MCLKYLNFRAKKQIKNTTQKMIECKNQLFGKMFIFGANIHNYEFETYRLKMRLFGVIFKQYVSLPVVHFD